MIIYAKYENFNMGYMFNKNKHTNNIVSIIVISHQKHRSAYFVVQRMEQPFSPKNKKSLPLRYQIIVASNVISKSSHPLLRYQIVKFVIAISNCQSCYYSIK